MAHLKLLNTKCKNTAKHSHGGDTYLAYLQEEILANHARNITKNIIMFNAKSQMLEGSLGDLTTLPIMAALMTGSFDLSTAAFSTGYSDISSDVIATASCGACVLNEDFAGPDYYVTLSASAGAVVLDDVTTGQNAKSLFVYISASSPDPADSKLLACFVTSSGAGIDINTNDGDVTFNWDANGIFGLSCGI